MVNLFAWAVGDAPIKEGNTLSLMYKERMILL